MSPSPKWEKILQIVNHPDLKRYYDGDLVYFNEREIISKKGFVLVPDRLVFLNDSEVVIIDYKTGKENDSHKIQLNKYKYLTLTSHLQSYQHS